MSYTFCQYFLACDWCEHRTTFCNFIYNLNKSKMWYGDNTDHSQKAE